LRDNGRKDFDISSTRIRSMYVDKDVILCATINGAVEITKDETTYYTEDNGLINQSLVCMFKDRENNYWFGTDSDGLLKFLGKSIISYSTDDGLSSNKVMSINQEPNGNLIFGTYRAGISQRINDTLYHYLNEQNGLKNNNIWATYVDEDGKCWIGTTGGVECYSHDQIIARDLTKSIENKIRTIIHSDGMYFFGGTKGVHYINDSTSVHLENTAEMNVNDMAAFGDKIYIGSRDGLYVVNQSSGFQDVLQIPLEEKNIYSLTSDSEGNIWVGTINGLFIIRPDNTIIPFELDKNDFQSKTVLGLLESKNGDIWTSTMNGVYQIQIPDKNQLKYQINHYGIAEGLINLESNLNALFEDNEGKIWVGTASGVARIDPHLNDELFDFKSPELHFTGIRLFMEDFDYGQYEVDYETNGDIPSAITLPYNKNHLTFDFIGLNLKDAKSVLYEYRLLGANSSWSPLSGTNYATYSAISPGTYDFEVRATNKSFEWSTIRSIHIIIDPPFWRSWWFILLSFAVAFFIIALIFQNRIKVIKQGQENERLGYKNRLLFLEQQSLNASMNRHFIFNSKPESIEIS